MKFVLAACVFFLALSYNVQSLASEQAGKVNPSQVCTPESTEHCVTDGNAAPHAQGDATSHHSPLSERMNSLFPEKQKNPTNVSRPAVTKLVSPKFLSAVSAPTAKLEWAPAAGANSYHVQVATDPNFKWLVANETLLQSNTFEVSGLEPGKKYFWRVASMNSANDASYIKSLFVDSAFTTSAK